MNTRLVAPPWGAPPLTQEAEEALGVIGSEVWRDACVEFYAERQAKTQVGKRAPKGMQGTLNRILEQRFHEAGWIASDGYFIKGETWVRATFRHQMSLGSDILAAMKVCKLEGIKLALILAADRKTLDIITPNDAPALVSFEKLKAEISSLDGVIDIPLLIGELTPSTSASPYIDEKIRKARPRDKTVPVNS